MGRNEGKNGMDKIESILNEMSLEDKIALCSGASFWETKKFDAYGILPLFMCDGPHGLRKQEDGADMLTMDFSIHAKYGIVTPEGDFMEVEIPYQGSEYVNNFVFSEDGRLFGSALGGKVYEVDRNTGSGKEVMELSGWVQHMAAKDGRLMMVNRDGVTIADMDTWEIVEDEALDDFLGEQGDSLTYVTAGIQPLLLMPGFPAHSTMRCGCR